MEAPLGVEVREPLAQPGPAEARPVAVICEVAFKVEVAQEEAESEPGELREPSGEKRRRAGVAAEGPQEGIQVIFGHGMPKGVLWVSLLVRNGFYAYGPGFGTDGAGNGTAGSLYDTQE